jgi:hypothetical protein
MNNHIQLLKKKVKLSTNQLITEVSSQSNGLVTDVRKTSEKNLEVERCFVSTAGSNSLIGTGWVINSSVNGCIICFAKFGIFNRRHHCRACGTLACGKCCNLFAALLSLESFGRFRVCKNCFQGEVITYQVNNCFLV